MKLLLLSVLSLALTIHSTAWAQAQLGQHPPCNVCGCSFCTEGDFIMTNVDGTFELEDWIASYDGLFHNETEWALLAEFSADFPIQTIQCVLLQLAGSGGVLSEDLCSDEMRLNPVVRESCGCTALPEHPAAYNPFSGHGAAAPNVPEGNSDKELSSQSTDIHRNRRGLLIPSLAVGLVLMTLVAIALAVYCWGAASKNQKEASVAGTDIVPADNNSIA